MKLRSNIDELIYRSCMALDANDFAGYLELCDPEFNYAITAYSPEIRKDMVWLEHDKEALKLLFNNLPRHNSDRSPLSRLANVYTVDIDEANGTAKVVSGLQVYKTSLDGGATELFAVGKLHDTVRIREDRGTLLNRNIRLDTRMLGIGYHIPL
jgi:methanesulfonate monooxygenase small subunit